ncbi:MAG: hypothetical protein P2A85_29295 (plasmid) [Microcoleus anatoxicus]|uniref:hypothetical protein n=1 Tax=Microcoleus anatoxicus TaxID=2705319 RepID=UPI003671F790
MSDKISVIFASFLFSALPVMLIYVVNSVYHDGYKQGIKDSPATVVEGNQNIDNSTHNHYQFSPSLGNK